MNVNVNVNENKNKNKNKNKNGNKKIKCALYTLLFRLTPLDAWRVSLMDRHFSQCPRCSQATPADEDVKQLPVSLKDAQTLPPLWPRLHLEPSHPKPSRHPKHPWRWTYAAITASLLLLLLLVPFNDNRENPEAGETGQVVVRSVKIGSKAAKYYVFHSKNPDKLIVWAQPQTN
ncbi:MAG: hypothetical protein GY940_03555 [bacterium]|nr:hypothetical protein [bacterium]